MKRKKQKQQNKRNMKITEANATVVQSQLCPGLFEAKLTHTVKETKADFQYIGPKFSKEMWNEVLSFFKWTQADYRSEAQVRLYVNPEIGWKAWAFPQKGNTGMTSQELPELPEFKAQRAQFGDEWIPYGTIHHHCSASAFQSGTDSSNEKGQEGIHITVGNMDKDVHDIHTRFYYKGCKFSPDMSLFWDIGESIKAKAEEMRMLFSFTADMSHIAVNQMSATCSKEQPFPEVWKSNYMVARVEAVTQFQRGPIGQWNGVGSAQQTWEDQGVPGFPSRAIRSLRRKFKALCCGNPEQGDQVLEEIIENLTASEEALVVMDALKEHSCKIEDIKEKMTGIFMMEDVDEPAKDSKKVIGGISEDEGWRLGYGC